MKNTYIDLSMEIPKKMVVYRCEKGTIQPS